MAHEPRNRLTRSLPEGQVEIEDRHGRTRALAAEALLVAAASDYSGAKALSIGEPGPPSILSGEPGYRYRSADLEVALTREELLRLIFNALTPDEYLKLREAFGEFDEIDARFYAPDTGEALQPKVRVPGSRL